MPHTAKPIPRPCPRCGRRILQKYFKLCGRCRAQDRKLKKERQKLAKEFRRLLS